MDAANESLHDVSDEALVDLLRRGQRPDDRGARSAQAFGLLLERAQPVIRARTEAALRRAGEDSRVVRDDLLQEGMLGFLNAVAAYRPGKGASFRTFLSVCVANRLESALRKGSKLPLEQPLSEAELPPGSESMDPQDIYAAMEDARRVQDVTQRLLTPLERGVLEAHMDGERYEAIARRLGVSPKAVDNALQRARKKLQRYL